MHRVEMRAQSVDSGESDEQKHEHPADDDDKNGREGEPSHASGLFGIDA